VVWEVEYTDQFGVWWEALSDGERVAVSAKVALLEEYGPLLGEPHSSKIIGSRHSHMRELRIQYKGHPYRIFYAFDRRQVAILLVGGDKKGDDRFYDAFVASADRLYDDHVAEVGKWREKDG
jgi:hypothetical protein